MPVHLFGRAANMDAIMEIAKEHNLYVIEDNVKLLEPIILQKMVLKKSRNYRTCTCSSNIIFPIKNLGYYGDGGDFY